MIKTLDTECRALMFSVTLLHGQSLTSQSSNFVIFFLLLFLLSIWFIRSFLTISTFIFSRILCVVSTARETNMFIVPDPGQQALGSLHCLLATPTSNKHPASD